MNLWLHVCDLENHCRSRCAHLFIQRSDGQWRSRCNRIVVKSRSQTEKINPSFSKCHMCIPFEIRLKPNSKSVKLPKLN